MFDSVQQIIARAEETGKLFWDVVLEEDLRQRQVSREQSLHKMLAIWKAMEDASHN